MSDSTYTAIVRVMEFIMAIGAFGTAAILFILGWMLYRSNRP